MKIKIIIYRFKRLAFYFFNIPGLILIVDFIDFTLMGTVFETFVGGLIIDIRVFGVLSAPKFGDACCSEDTTFFVVDKPLQF